MAHSTNSNDDKLIEELKNKLEWFTFQATEDEFDPDQVRTILQLLDALDPLEASDTEDELDFPELEPSDKNMMAAEPDPAAAFDRFKKKYNISDEDLEEKDRKPDSGDKIVPFHMETAAELAFDPAMVRQSLKQSKSAIQSGGSESAAAFRKAAAGAKDIALPVADGDMRSAGTGSKSRTRRLLSALRMGAFGKVAVAVAIVIVGVTGLSIASNADPLKSFFEIVRDGANGMKITVTGNEMESESDGIVALNENLSYYDSWEELEEKLNITILKPTYIPEDMKLAELFSKEYHNYVFCEGVYNNTEDSIILRINLYDAHYTKSNIKLDEGWKKINNINDDSIQYLKKDNYYKLIWSDGNGVYNLTGKNLDDLENIINNLYK